MMPISPSRIVRQAIGLSPVDGFAGPACACMACGITIPAGKPRSGWRPALATFTDWQYLATSGEAICVDCAALVGNAGLEWSQQGVYSAAGAYMLSLDAHWLWFFNNPPEPPFVLLRSDAQKQHLAWRARVSLSRDLIALQLGRSTLRIDRQRLFSGIETARAASEIAAKSLPIKQAHPFVMLDRNLRDPRHGRIRSDVAALARTDPTLQAMLDALNQLGEGELWAMSLLARVKPIEPVEPPGIEQARSLRAQKRREREADQNPAD